MNDQAASLRKLKQLADMASEVQFIDPETFLSQVPRPSPFTAIAMVFPDEIVTQLPTTLEWVSGLMQFSPRACLWDQAGIVPTTRIPTTQIKLKYPTPVRIESGLTPLSILPQIRDFQKVCKESEVTRISFLQHLIRCLKSSSEVWITIKASQLSQYNSILHSTDAACLIIPQHNDSIIRGYETVKNIHLSGYFSPIGLLDIAPFKPPQNQRLSQRIKIVAKQFLALDLVPAGVVLSNCTYIPPDSQPCLRSRLTATDANSRDFLYCLSESLIYQLPGMF